MSFSFIGPWLLALWARAEEAGRGGTVNEHLERVIPTLGHVAQGAPLVYILDGIRSGSLR